MKPPPPYAELHALSNFTFLRGASHPEELVARAAELNYHALAITDECSLAGVVRAHLAAKEYGIHLIIGSELHLQEGMQLVLLASDREGYGQLAHLITQARRRAQKGSYQLSRTDLEGTPLNGCLALWLPGEEIDPGEPAWLARHFPGRCWIAVELLLTGVDQRRLARLQRLADTLQLPLCATGGVLMHRRERQMVQDTLTAIRLGRPLEHLGTALQPNGERHLRSRQRLAHLYPRELLEESCRIADRCHFSLDELRYEYPHELVPAGHTPASWLTRLVEEGMHRRWPSGIPAKIHRQVEHELALIRELRYEPYFLTVHDIVRFARNRGILCQGRGSAANSTVCYCLGITEVDPARLDLLFERFISRERDEPPDIDVDFEHERREEVIQYIYRKYGRNRTALAATVICYRPRSAIRDVGKALGLEQDQIHRITRSVRWWDGNQLAPESLKEAGFSPDNPLIRRLSHLVETIIGFPRHLSQHVGGFVISEGSLSHLVPIENAAMPERTVIQWEKDDLEALGLLKVDVLALGMLSAIRKALDYINRYYGTSLTMATIPAEDPAVYRLIQQADTIGVFQIESRAQISMLPRLRPRCFYDLVIQIAIVRPGPIQGEMVHPYLQRRNGEEPVTYPSPAVKKVLERTLGVPIFQEQVMQLAMVAAGFSAGEADQLRRAMAAWKRKGGLEKFEQKLLSGMQERGYPDHFARQIFRQIKGFGEYGFPESHSASFALLAYLSAWLKCHHPAAFTCALLNSQPMGFYAPAQLVQDAARHGVEIRPVDLRYSEWDCTLEAGEENRPALRLGLRLVKGLSQNAVRRLLSARRQAPFRDLQEIVSRAALTQSDLEALAAADALRGLAGNRHRAHWEASGTEHPLPLFPVPRFREATPLLRPPTEREEVVADYATTGLTLRRHPLALLRNRLRQQHICTARELRQLPSGSLARVAGLVIGRQRPGSASGVIFVTLEDETGICNIIVWPKFAEAQRRPLLASRLLMVTGTVQQEAGVLHLVAGRLEDWSHWLGTLPISSRDFH